MSRKFLNGIDVTNQKIVNLASPSASADAANKGYVDALITGLQWKPSVRAATTVTGTLASAYANGQSIDGVTLATGDRILIKNQTSGAENGIYVVAATGAPTRATDMDGAGELVPNATVFVNEGTVNADTAWTCTNNGTLTIGSTATVWAQFGGGIVYSNGNGLNLSANTFSVKADTGISVSSTGVAIDNSVVVRKYATTVGDGASTAITVTHSLGTRDVVVRLYDASTYDQVECDVNHATTNTVTLTFAVAPSSNAYRCFVFA